MNLERAFLYPIVIMASLGGAGAAGAQATAFLCANGIAGSSTDAEFVGCSEIFGVSYSVGIEGGVPPPIGGGAGAPKTTCGLYEVNKAFDAASIPILIESLLGQSIAELKVAIRKQGALPLVFYELVLKNVLIVQVQQSLTSDVGVPFERIVLRPDQVNWKFTPQDANGAAGTPVQGGFDCLVNAPL